VDLDDSPSITVLVQSAKTITAAFELDPETKYDLSAHALEEGPYSFSGWSPEAPAGTYPEHMIFEQTGEEDPVLGAEMDSSWSLPYNLTSRSRIVGLGDDGFGFIITGSPQATVGAGYLGSAVLALNTLGEENIRVSWKGGTVHP